MIRFSTLSLVLFWSAKVSSVRRLSGRPVAPLYFTFYSSARVQHVTGCSSGTKRVAPGGAPSHYRSTLASRPRRRGLRPAYVDPVGPVASLPLPAVDRGAQLEEGDDSRWDRQPEGDHPIGEDGREHLCAGQAEEDEGADQTGVHRSHAARGKWNEVRERPEEEALDDDAERHGNVERVEARPQDRDVGRPEPDPSADRHGPGA